MCVMDFAGDYNTPDVNNNAVENKNMDIDIKMNKEDMMNNSNFANNNMNMNNNINNNNNPNNQSPLVKLSLDNDDMKNNLVNQNLNLVSNNQNVNIPNNDNTGMAPNGNQNDVDKTVFDTINAMNNTKIISKKVEITTTVTFTYEDGSTRTATQCQNHEYK